jgi:hypothetical protein
MIMIFLMSERLGIDVLSGRFAAGLRGRAWGTVFT